jgi:hypothetical protein
LSSGSFAQFTDDNRYFKDSAKISPNGKLVAYRMWRFGEKEIEEKLLISRLDRTCNWTIPLGNIDYFAWSPDSQNMFLSGTDGVYMAELQVLFGSGIVSGNHCP